MRIFFSHNHRDKPLLREIARFFPYYIPVWIDENQLLAGEDLFKKIKECINSQVDFIVFFYSQEAIKSKWVERELHWSLQREKEEKRIFIIPVLLDDKCISILPVQLINRLFLECFRFTENDVKIFSKKLYDLLFNYALLSLDNRSERAFDNNKKIVTQRFKRIIDSFKFHITQPINNSEIIELISLIDIKNRLYLLFLYEIANRIISRKIDLKELDKGNNVIIKLYTERINTWIWTIEYQNDPKEFFTLRYEYGLGDEKYLVRDEVFILLKNLSEDEFTKLFSNIKIEELKTDRLF